MALEINSQVDRLDLNDVHARLARDRGVPIVISSDAHSRHALRRTCAGASRSARRAWLQPADVLNTRPFDEFRASLRRAPETALMKLPMLSADDKLAEIRRLYFTDDAGRRFSRISTKALDLLKSMASEEERERATVYMEGLAQMRRTGRQDGRARARQRAKERSS